MLTLAPPSGWVTCRTSDVTAASALVIEACREFTDSAGNRLRETCDEVFAGVAEAQAGTEG